MNRGRKTGCAWIRAVFIKGQFSWGMALLVAGCTKNQDPLDQFAFSGHMPKSPITAKTATFVVPASGGNAATSRKHHFGTWVPVIASKPGEGIWGLDLREDGRFTIFPGLDEETITGTYRAQITEGFLTNQITYRSGRTAYDLVQILEQLQENPDRAYLYMPQGYAKTRLQPIVGAGGYRKPQEGSMNRTEMIRIVDPANAREVQLGVEFLAISAELREAKSMENQLTQRQVELSGYRRNAMDVMAELAANERELAALRSRGTQLAVARGAIESALRNEARKRSMVGLDDNAFVRVEKLILELRSIQPPADSLTIFEAESARLKHAEKEKTR